MSLSGLWRRAWAAALYQVAGPFDTKPKLADRTVW